MRDQIESGEGGAGQAGGVAGWEGGLRHKLCCSDGHVFLGG